YTWTLPSGWIQTAGGTSNSITVTTGSTGGSVSVAPYNSCGIGSAQTLTVTSQPAPTVDLGPDQTICNDESTTLDAGAGFTSYSWTGGATTQTLTVDGAVLGVGNHTITVTVTNSYTCSASNDIIITVEDCSGIETATLQIGNVYPNPASESINIAFAAEHNNLVINLFDATGRLVSSQSLKNTTSGNVVVIPVSQLSAGVYSLQLVSEEGIQISTVVIE
ncbi:MAG TPA: T9SS type A sorting domain-containing protein, partial [Bacteroidales bacterium]|nr:T9SS type A sorting domain-containing protein [Bacteroidales bacterium]